MTPVAPARITEDRSHPFGFAQGRLWVQGGPQGTRRIPVARPQIGSSVRAGWMSHVTGGTPSLPEVWEV